MKRTKYMLTDDEAEVINCYRDAINWGRTIQRRSNKKREKLESRVRCQAILGLYQQNGQCTYEAKYDGKWCGNHRPGRHKGVDRMRDLQSLKSATLISKGSVR